MFASLAAGKIKYPRKVGVLVFWKSVEEMASAE